MFTSQQHICFHVPDRCWAQQDGAGSASRIHSICKVWSVCTYTDHRSDCGGVTWEAASDRSLRSNWPELSFDVHAVRPQLSASSRFAPAVSRQLRPETSDRTERERVGSVRVWQPGYCRTQARLRCGWGGGGGGWWLSSLSGSNWDESTDGTAAVDGYCALVYSGTKAAAVLDIFAVSKKGYRLFIVLRFCRIADASHHMI